jgi:UDP-2,3-diacylglucosamine hydrolase
MQVSDNPILLVSDLHLTAEREHLNRIFLRFLRGEARSAQALYILGDLFEHWIGDDDLDDPFHAAIAAGLGALTAGGCPVYFMAGNRDFLIGSGFAQATGVRLLTDPTIADFHSTPTLLMHGDTLCTADIEYQRFRAYARSPEPQREFLAKPLAERRAYALDLRRRSQLDKSGKTDEIMDVSADAVEQAFARYGCARLIHGHTHRPARHELLVSGRTCERWVLADWHDRGEYLEVGADAIRRVSLDDR